MEIYLASANQNKVKELQAMLFSAGLDIGVHAGSSLGKMPEVEETEDTFEGNARLKAKALQQYAPKNAWILADDSGLTVEALQGAPGIYSSRYAGPQATDQDNIQKLLLDLKNTNSNNHAAAFICCIVLRHPSINEIVFQASVKGHITTTPQGAEGFGYDPIFIPIGYNQTYAQLGQEIKNTISHRALAMRQLTHWLLQLN